MAACATIETDCVFATKCTFLEVYGGLNILYGMWNLSFQTTCGAGTVPVELTYT